MNCEEIKNKLSSFSEGEIFGIEAEEIISHLEKCKDCLNEKEQLEKLWNLLDDATAIEPSSCFRRELWQRIDKLADKRKTLLPLFGLDFRKVFGLATVGFVVAFIIFLNIITTTHLIAPQSTNGYAAKAKLPEEEKEVIANIGVLENMELLQDLDLIENMGYVIPVDNGVNNKRVINNDSENDEDDE